MMIRQHETPYSVLAGLLAILMHVMLFAALFFSVNWKSVHIASEVMEVELWEQLPRPDAKPVAQPKPKPKPKEIEPPKPEPEPIKVEEPKVEEPKVDIALEKKKKEEARKKKLAEEKKKKALEEKRKEAAKKKLAQQLLAEDNAAKEEEKKKKLAQELLAADAKAEADRRASAAAQGEVNKYIAKIQAKVRGNVNKSLCGTGDPVLKFKVDILPTGDVARDPQLVKSSGMEACDEAVSRAVLASQPLPLPKDPAIKSKFRNLTFIFKPND